MHSRFTTISIRKSCPETFTKNWAHHQDVDAGTPALYMSIGKGNLSIMEQDGDMHDLQTDKNLTLVTMADNCPLEGYKLHVLMILPNSSL